MTDVWLIDFIKESNAIEDIHHAPTPEEIRMYRKFLRLDEVTIRDLSNFVNFAEPGAFLRARDGQDVRVGRFAPPPGGPKIAEKLEELLAPLNSSSDPFKVHCEYEMLHPFIDCNGRSGRLLWLWMMINSNPHNRSTAMNLGFLRSFYYQTLAAAPTLLEIKHV